MYARYIRIYNATTETYHEHSYTSTADNLGYALLSICYCIAHTYAGIYSAELRPSAIQRPNAEFEDHTGIGH